MKVLHGAVVPFLWPTVHAQSTPSSSARSTSILSPAPTLLGSSPPQHKLLCPTLPPTLSRHSLAAASARAARRYLDNYAVKGPNVEQAYHAQVSPLNFSAETRTNSQVPSAGSFMPEGDRLAAASQPGMIRYDQLRVSRSTPRRQW